MMAAKDQNNDIYEPSDQLHLWFLANPAQPRLVGSIRLVRKTMAQPGGVSLQYGSEWISSGFPLSDDLPLRGGEFMPSIQDSAVGAVDDARPDRWGERVIRFLDRPPRLSTLEYLYFAGDERFGALGVSTSATSYRPRTGGALPNLSDVQSIQDLVSKIESNQPVEEHLRRLLSPGTLGGARPKAIIQARGAHWIVKFAEGGDEIDTPIVEHACMSMARLAGIDTCETFAIPLERGHAVAVRRFDRSSVAQPLDDQPDAESAGTTTRVMRYHAMTAGVALRAAGQDFAYPDLALLLRRRGISDLIAENGAQLFRRMVFNILIDNTDDHEKNHALLVNESGQLTLSPAYDALPTALSLGYQQFRVGVDGADSTIVNALSEHRSFMLTEEEACRICGEVASVVDSWTVHFQAEGVTQQDIDILSRHIDRDFLLAQRQAAHDAQQHLPPRPPGPGRNR